MNGITDVMMLFKPVNSQDLIANSSVLLLQISL